MTATQHDATEPSDTPDSGPVLEGAADEAGVAHAAAPDTPSEPILSAPVEVQAEAPVLDVPEETVVDLPIDAPDVQVPPEIVIPDDVLDSPEDVVDDAVPVDELDEAADALPPDPHARHTKLASIARITQISAAAIVGLLLLGIFGVQIAEGDQVRTGVNAFGVDLSGMTREEATAALTDAVDAQSRQTLRLTDGGEAWPLSQADLGVRVDIDGVVDDAFAKGRRGWGASRLAVLWHVRDAESVVGENRIAVDPDALNQELATIGAEIEQPKIEAVLTISPEATVNYVPSQVGRALNVDASVGAILMALAAGSTTQPLVIDETQPLRPDAVYTDAKAQLEKILDAPIEVVAVDQTWTLAPDQIAYWLDLSQPQNGQPAQVTINEQWIFDIVDEIAWATDRDPKSARVWWDGGGALVQTQPGIDGRTLDQAQSEPLITNAFLGKDATNRVELPVAVINMTTLPADLSGLGINTVVAEASTIYGGSLPARMHNIELAASRLNGTLIMPGQTFSFNAEVGSTSTEAGFQVAYGIDASGGGVSTVPSVGGGICQVATTVFQPVFWAGYEVHQRNTHAYWISRYESRGYAGLDATVDEASGLDFTWTNNTSTAVLLEASTNGEYFTVRLYGTVPNWRVEVDAPVITNEKPADTSTHYEPTYDLPAGSTREVEHASDGFDTSIIRRVIAGDQVDQMEFIAHYLPARNVVLVGTEDGSLPSEYLAVNEEEYTEEPSEYIEEPELTEEVEESTDAEVTDDSSSGTLDEEAPPEE